MISIRVGKEDFFAFSIALSISEIFSPSFTKRVFHPKDSNRPLTFSVKVLETGPSKLISFESYKTIKLFNLKFPAKEAAS